MVIMMTAFEDVKTVITSMKMGAFDYLVKPLDMDEIEIIVERALENLNLKKELETLRRAYIREFDIQNIVTASDKIREAFHKADRVAQSHDTTASIKGETGTGRNYRPRYMHYPSDPSGSSSLPFIVQSTGILVEVSFLVMRRAHLLAGCTRGRKKNRLQTEGRYSWTRSVRFPPRYR